MTEENPAPHGSGIEISRKREGWQTTILTTEADFDLRHPAAPAAQAILAEAPDADLDLRPGDADLGLRPGDADLGLRPAADPSSGVPAAASPPDGDPPPTRSGPSSAPQAVPMFGSGRAVALTVGTTLTILAALFLGLLLDATVIGRVRHDRDRQVAYAHLRYDLANGTTPTGAYDVNGDPVAAGTPVAVLNIDDLGLHEVVRYGTTSSILMSGPGLRRDTVLPGQPGTSIILGRRALFGGPFGAIGKLKPGETFEVVTAQERNQFRVVDVRHAKDPVPAEFLQAPASLVLITSDGNEFMPIDVLRVDAILVDPSKVQPAGPVGPALPNDKALAGEGVAWVPLVFWGQALTLAAVATTWLRARWGVRQSWLVGAPVLIALGLAAADTAVRLLPNVM